MIDAGIISAGVGLLGSIFGRKKEKPTTTVSTSTVDLGKMVQDAEAQGYNRLTALRAGLANGYVTTTSTGSGGGGGGGGMGGIAEAAAGFAGSLFGAFNNPKTDPIARKSSAAGTATLVKHQLRGADLRPGSVTSKARTTTLVSPTTSYKATNGRLLAPYVEDGKLSNTDPWRWTGGWIEADPNRTDAANYEDAYGDLTGSVFGGVIPLALDAWHNAKRGYRAVRAYVPSADHGVLGRFKSVKPRRLVYSDKGPAGR